MIGRLTKSLICIGVIMTMAPRPDGAPDLASLAGEAGRAVAAQAIGQTQALCAADLARCARALAQAGALDAAVRAGAETGKPAQPGSNSGRKGG